MLVKLKDLKDKYEFWILKYLYFIFWKDIYFVNNVFYKKLKFNFLIYHYF